MSLTPSAALSSIDDAPGIASFGRLADEAKSIVIIAQFILRQFLMYAGKLYDKFIYMVKLNRYGKRLMPLPVPKLVCLYNGEDPKEDEVTLRLSDAFREEIRRNVQAKDDSLTREQAEEEAERRLAEADPDIEVRVRMININHGHNRELMEPVGRWRNTRGSWRG